MFGICAHREYFAANLLHTFSPQILVDDLKISQSFIELLEKAALQSDVEPLPSDVIQQLRNPPRHTLSVDDPDHRYSMDLFFALNNASVDEYNDARDAYLRRHPGSSILSFYEVRPHYPLPEQC